MSQQIARFQAKLGITPDGVFGPQTIKAAREYFGVNSYAIANFFANCHHETGGFARFEESLNYTKPERIVAVFRRFDLDKDRVVDPEEIALARTFIRQPEKLAEFVYGGRMGNNRPGDAFACRGRGALHLTGRDNYRAFAASAPAFARAATMPELVANEFAFDSAAWFFDVNGIWDIAGRGVRDEVITQVRRKVQGGTLGLDEVKRLTKQFFNWTK